MMLYLFILLKSFKLETKLIIIQQDTLSITDLIPAEQIFKKFRSCSKVLEYGIHYRSTSKMLRPLVYLGRMQPKLNTLIYLNNRLYFIFFKCRRVFNCPWGGGGDLYYS